MTRRDDLQALYDAVKAVNDGAFYPDPVFGDISGPLWHHASGAYHGSLDAALALMGAVLPEWTVNSLHQNRHPDKGMRPDGTWTCLLFAATEKAFLHKEEKADIPARALLLAILSALIAQEGE